MANDIPQPHFSPEFESFLNAFEKASLTERRWGMDYIIADKEGDDEPGDVPPNDEPAFSMEQETRLRRLIQEVLDAECTERKADAPLIG